MRKRKFWVPDGSFDIGALEGWLEHLAAKGWILKEQRTYRALFVSALPAKCRVRLEPVADRTQQRQEELDALYAEMGWERKGALRDYIAYYCGDDSAPELHTDPAAANWSREKRLKKAGRELFFSWLIFFLGAGIGLHRVLTAENPLESVICNASASVLLFIILLPWLIWKTADALKAISTLHREMDAQLPLRHSGDWRKARRSTAVALLAIILFWGCLIVEPLWRLYYARSVDDVVWHPYLEAVELDSALDLSCREIDFFTRDTSLLAPVQYHRWERWEGGESLTTDCDVLRFERLTQPLYEEWLTRLISEVPEAEFRSLSDPRFDRADFWTNGEREVLYLARGKAIMRIDAFGIQGLCDHLDDYEAILTQCG